SITRWRILSAPLPAYRERQARRGRLTSMAGWWSWAGAEPHPTHRTRWTSIARALTPGQLTHLFPHSSLRAATSQPIPTARPGFGWQAAMHLPRQRLRWKGSAPVGLQRQRLLQPRQLLTRPQLRQPELLALRRGLLRRRDRDRHHRLGRRP